MNNDLFPWIGSKPTAEVKAPELLAALRLIEGRNAHESAHMLNFRPDFIEHQLAHSVRDPNGRAYNRTSHLAERHKMMQAWADYLDNLKAQVVSAPAKEST